MLLGNRPQILPFATVISYVVPLGWIHSWNDVCLATSGAILASVDVRARRISSFFISSSPSFSFVRTTYTFRGFVQTQQFYRTTEYSLFLEDTENCFASFLRTEKSRCIFFAAQSKQMLHHNQNKCCTTIQTRVSSQSKQMLHHVFSYVYEPIQLGIFHHNRISIIFFNAQKRDRVIKCW